MSQCIHFIIKKHLKMLVTALGKINILFHAKYTTNTFSYLCTLKKNAKMQCPAIVLLVYFKSVKLALYVMHFNCAEVPLKRCLVYLIVLKWNYCKCTLNI